MRTVFSGKSVLVTGAGGSIGSQLCDKAASDGAEAIALLGHSEGPIYDAHRHLVSRYPHTEFKPVIGSVGNESLLWKILAGVDIVIHAAAHKHVPLCESNPVEAIENNVFGTLRLANAARREGVRQFCLISTDKAVQPTSVMGATKRLCEMLIASMSRESKFFAVRFGNVLDSAGSVLPLWREQIKAGGPLTITDERCERYFMSIPNAVGLITDVINMKPGLGIFVLDMGRPRKMVDVAHDLMRQMGISVPIKVTGLRPGEKLTEELQHGGQLLQTATEGVFLVKEPKPFVDYEKLADLEQACIDHDKEQALLTLWNMVRC